MPNIKQSHDYYRQSICISCFRKCKYPRTITDQQRKLIDDFVVSGLDPLDERLPSVICTSCRLQLSRYEKGQGSLEKFPRFDYSQLRSLTPPHKNLTFMSVFFVRGWENQS